MQSHKTLDQLESIVKFISWGGVPPAPVLGVVHRELVTTLSQVRRFERGSELPTMFDKTEARIHVQDESHSQWVCFLHERFAEAARCSLKERRATPVPSVVKFILGRTYSILIAKTNARPVGLHRHSPPPVLPWTYCIGSSAFPETPEIKGYPRRQ